MRSILTLSLLITLCGSANAATVHHAHRRHVLNQGMIASDPASGFAYAPPGPPTHYRAAPYYLNRITELPRVTRLAKRNDFSTVSDGVVRRSLQRADNRGCGRYLLSTVAERSYSGQLHPKQHRRDQPRITFVRLRQP
jgi:hypothetical protein